MPADETDLTSGFFFFSPVRKKFFLRATGAWADLKYLAFGNSSTVQNGLVEVA